MSYFIIVFKNTHDAMSAEKELLPLDYNFRIMPTPTTITQSCGICIRFEKEEDIRRIIDSKIINFKGIYMREDTGYKIIIE